MKTIIALLVLLGLFTAPLGAVPKASDRWLDNITLDTTFSSHYWGSIVGGIFYGGGAVNFTNLTVSKDDSWGSTYAFIGMINPMDTLKYDHLGGTEYYGAVGRTVNLWKGDDSDLPLVKLNFMLLYDSISQIERLNDDLWEQFVRIDLPRVPFVQPFVEFYHWNAAGRNSPPTGHFIKAGIHRQQPLGFKFHDKPVELSIDLLAGWSSEGLFGNSAGLAYYRMILSSELQITDRMKFIPSIVGQLPGGGQDDDRRFVDRPRLFYNATLKWEF